MNFAFHLITATGGTFPPAYQSISSNSDEKIRPANRWGAFHALFGLSSRQFILVTSGEQQGIRARLTAADDVANVDTLLLTPTVRPVDDEPRTKSGLYVFRFFDVRNDDVDQIAQLSKQAWEYFESTSRYNAIPQALFCEQNRVNEHGKMLLVTWYDGLNSWQESRNQEPGAAKNFRKRARLTLSTRALATRLLDPEDD